jgi:transposase
MGYIEGRSREQGILFPPTLEEYIAENNEVRAIAAFIEYLPFEELGFVRGEAAETGRPGYDPRMLLGLYIWGHLNRVRSSRRLERESGRNMELMWLTGLLKPDFKTLCRFRRDNGEAISEVLARFGEWCREAGLYGKELVAIDGSKFKAVNSNGNNITQKKLEKMIERERARARRYLEELEEADALEEGEEKPLTGEELKKKIEGIREYLKEREGLLEEMREKGENQRSMTDPDSRMMKTAKGMQVGYNVQTAVDARHKLIVAVEVTNEAADQEQLPDMARRAKEGLNVEELTVVADGGYFGFEAIKACEDEGVTAYVPVRESADAEHRGLFSRERFSYDDERDAYICPAGEELKPVSRGVKKARYSKEYRVYGTKECGSCPLRLECTTSKYGRKIKRWVHHEVLDRLRARLRENPEILKQRKSLVEHPFGTIKVAMNHERLLMKGLKHVGTEIKLTVLCYNFKRVMSILGIETMIEMLKTSKNPAMQPV